MKLNTTVYGLLLATTYFFSLVTDTIGAQSLRQPPFPEALGNAAIVQEDIADVLENGLIIGNGDINALVHTEGGRLVVRLSKNDIGDWRNDTATDNTLIPFQKLRELGKKGRIDGRDRQQMGWNRNVYPTPLSCGKVILDLPTQGKTPAVLDIAQGVAKVGSMDIKGATPITIRALADRNVFLIEGQGGIELFSQQAKYIGPATPGKEGDIKTLFQKFPSSIDWPGMSYAVAVAENGSKKVVAVVSSFEAKDPLAAAVKLARTTMAEIDKAVQTHDRDWADFWTASGIELANKDLESAWYRNLYFLRTVSRANTAKAGLFAGVFADAPPAWHAGHTMNYNSQQSVWSGFATNHVDLADSYRWLIVRNMKNAKWLCRQLFGSDGIYIPHNLITYQADHASSKQPLGGVHIHMPWGYSVGMTGWAGQNLWWQYQYAPDEKFLRHTAYPVLKEAAVFYANFIDTCDKQPDGKVLFGPSVSPEHFGMSSDLKMNWNETNGLVFAQFGLKAAIEAAGILQTDKELVARWKKALTMLPPLPTSGAAGDEVVVAVKGAKPMNYNVPVAAHPVFPSEQITWFSPESEKALMKRTLSRLHSNGNNDIMTLVIARARISLPETYDFVVDQFAARYRPNGSFSLNRRGHHFNAFGHYVEHFAASAAISEMLLQSVGHIVRVFPAWPKDKDAAFSQLRAKGGFLISSSLIEGDVLNVTVKSTVGGKFSMLSPWSATIVERGGKEETLEVDSRGVVDLETDPGEKLVFKKGEAKVLED